MKKKKILFYIPLGVGNPQRTSKCRFNKDAETFRKIEYRGRFEIELL